MSRENDVASQKYSRFVIFLIDGLSSVTLEKLAQTGRIPTLARYMREGAYNNSVVSSFPTVTGPAHVPIFSGYNPSSIDIVGHNQYVRKEDTFENFLLYYESFTRRFGKRKTLYHEFDNSVAISEPFRAGASTYRKNLFALADWARIRGPANGYVLRTTRAEYRRGRDLIVAWLHETDGFAHMSKRETHISAALEQLDRFLRTFEKEIDQNTALGFVSDHGMERTTGKTFSLKKALRTLSRGKLAFKSYYDGGAFAQAYIERNGSYATRLYDDSLDNLTQKIANLPQIDLAMHRKSEDVFEIHSAKGVGRLTKQGEDSKYEVQSGNDPLGLIESGSIVDSADGWLERSGASNYPDAMYQVRELLSAPSSGDIIVTAAPKVTFNVLTRWGVHGGLNRDQSTTFMLFNKPLSGVPQHVMRTAAIPTIILKNKRAPR